MADVTTSFVLVFGTLLAWGSFPAIRRSVPHVDGQTFAVLSFVCEFFVTWLSILCFYLTSDESIFPTITTANQLFFGVLIFGGFSSGTLDTASLTALNHVPASVGYPVMVGASISCGTVVTFCIFGSSRPEMLLTAVGLILVSLGLQVWAAIWERKESISIIVAQELETITNPITDFDIVSSALSVYEPLPVTVAAADTYTPINTSVIATATTASATDITITTNSITTDKSADAASAMYNDTLLYTIPDESKSHALVHISELTAAATGTHKRDRTLSTKQWMVVLLLLGLCNSSFGPMSTFGREPFTSRETICVFMNARVFIQPFCHLFIYLCGYTRPLLLRTAWETPMKLKMCVFSSGLCLGGGYIMFFEGSQNLNKASSVAIGCSCALFTTVLGALILRDLREYTRMQKTAVFVSVFIFMGALVLLTLAAL
eukprot:m.34992 g.34992  ORF g.34992 m.34992 type:complete len:433 (+) comp17065_c0_seq2:252-1550(+)